MPATFEACAVMGCEDGVEEDIGEVKGPGDVELTEMPGEGVIIGTVMFIWAVVGTKVVGAKVDLAWRVTP